MINETNLKKISKTILSSRILHLFLVIIFVTGCSTGPTKMAESKPVPPERIYAFDKYIDGPSATMIVTRDKGYVGSGCFYGFRIDGVLAARIDPKETVTFIVPAKELVIRMERDSMGGLICSVDANHAVQRETTLKEGQTKYFRMSISSTGVLDVQRATPQETGVLNKVL